jgi:spore coat polysaccharide biosynthesis protein SpsF (cytidylyltransferase family)
MIGAVIQAQSHAGRQLRFPLAAVGETSVLGMVIERARAVPGVDVVVVATTGLLEDDAIAAAAAKERADVVRGPVTDVWRRYHIAQAKHKLSVLVRVTAECPLIDPVVIGRLVEAVKSKRLDHASNWHPRTWPSGLDAEAMAGPMFALCEPWSASDSLTVTEPIRRAAEFAKRAGNITCEPPLPSVRWIVTEDSDLEFLRALAPRLEPGNHKWHHTMACAADLLAEQPMAPFMLEHRRAL